MPWETFKSRLVVKAELVCTTGMRVGRGGEAAEPTASDLPVLTDADGRPLIPGSSLRGVLRSHVERIVRTLEPVHGGGKGACIPVVEDAWCVTEDRMRNLREQAAVKGDRWLADQVWDQSCRVCRVYGSPRLASRVRFSDLHCMNDAAAEVRDGVSIDRDKETVAHKYDFEVVPAGARFALYVVAENLDDKERGLFWLALQELRSGAVSLGGFKGRGLGRASLDESTLSIQIVDAADRSALKQYVLSGGTQMQTVGPGEADKWLNALWDAWEGVS
jgi:CRISPR-associated RAMP protein (TIGR02581 family)